MNGKNSFKKNFSRVQRASRPKSVTSTTNVTFINIDVGEWRISQDSEDGSLVIENVVTGIKHSFPRE